MESEHSERFFEDQVMIELDGLQQSQDEGDLLDRLVAQPATVNKKSSDYDYQPAPIQPPKEQDTQNGESDLKTSNHSTSTTADMEQEKQKPKCCTCKNSRCLKNYCQCFRQGRPCTQECLCVNCGNKHRLFSGYSCSYVTKCKCKKNHCLKNYCQCHSAGRRCGKECQCIQCQNIQKIQKMQEQHKFLFCPIEQLLYLRNYP